MTTSRQAFEMQIDKLFTDRDREAVNQAVQAAESGTSAEIVPVVAAESGRYDRAEDIIGLWFALLSLSAAWVLAPLPVTEVGHWGAPHKGWHLATLVVAALVGFCVGVVIGNRVDVLRRLFAPRVQMQEEVYARARAVFFDNRVHHTSGSAGVLLYVSLFEHMAAIIVDQTVLQKLGQEKVDALCAEFTQRLHRGPRTEALCETIRSVGQTLSPLLPRTDHDVNELPDALQLID